MLCLLAWRTGTLCDCEMTHRTSGEDKRAVYGAPTARLRWLGPVHGPV